MVFDDRASLLRIIYYILLIRVESIYSWRITFAIGHHDIPHAGMCVVFREGSVPHIPRQLEELSLWEQAQLRRESWFSRVCLIPTDIECL